jgi:hypothetical protein
MLGRGLRAVARSKIQSSRTRSATNTTPTSYSTNFPGTESVISEGGGVWQSQSTDLLRVSTSGGLAYGNQDNSLGYDDSYAFISPSYFTATPNQYGQAVIYREAAFNPAFNMEVEIILRCSDAVGSPGTRTWYEILWNKDGDFSIIYLTGIADGFTDLSAPFTQTVPADGDVFRGECIESGADTIITGYVNGVAKVAKTITGGSFRIASGQPGMAFFNRGPLSANPKFCYTSWEGGNL